MSSRLDTMSRHPVDVPRRSDTVTPRQRKTPSLRVQTQLRSHSHDTENTAWRPMRSGTRSPRSPSRLRSAAHAAQSLVGVMARSMSPTVASTLIDVPTTMSPVSMEPEEMPHEHTISMDVAEPIVAPQARHGAVYLRPRSRQTRRIRRRSAWAHVQAIARLVGHPRECLVLAFQYVCAQYTYWDHAFRDPVTDQRTWWPPWMQSYAPLLVWVVISLSSTVLVMLFHTPLFHALDHMSTLLRDQGLLGRVLFGALIFALTFPPMPLYSTMIVLSGFAFGMWQGFVVSYVAALSGAAAVFLLSRTYLHTWMMRVLAHAGGLQRVVHAIELRPQLLFLVRLAPYPYNLLNMLLASSHILSFRTYLSCTALALPKLLVHTSIGASIENWTTNRASNDAYTVRHMAGLCGMVLCVGIFIYLHHVTSRAVNDSLEHGSGEEYDMEDDVEPKSPGTPEHCDTTTSHAPSWLAESIEEFERAVE